MLNVNHPHSQHVVARLLDFFGSSTPWNRSLWGVSTTTAFRETTEASLAVQQGVLSEGSLKALIDELEQLVGQDAGIGDSNKRRVVQGYLSSAKKEGLRHGGELHAILEHLVAEIEGEYLGNWAVALDAMQPGQEKPGAERTARYLAGFMLASGQSEPYLHKWWTYWARRAAPTVSLADLVAKQQELCASSLHEFEVIVPFLNRLPSGVLSPSMWLGQPDAAAWFRRYGVTAPPRQYGAVVLTVRARDSWAAARRASQQVGRYVARLALAVPARPVQPSPLSWVRQSSPPLPGAKRVSAVPVRAEVGAIRRNQKVFTEPHDPLLNAAFELLSRVNRVSVSEPSAAVAEGWAAIEALLACPGDPSRGEAVVQRTAALVACSFGRAELTTLAHSHQKLPGEALSDALSTSSSNHDSAIAVERHLRNGGTLRLLDASDQMAERRLKRILLDPGRALADVKRHVASSIRRLYRQRNLVLHSGRTDAVALGDAVRASVPLLGAAVDRMAHAAFMRGVSPTVLAAQARVHLDLLGTGPASSLVDLLE